METIPPSLSLEKSPVPKAVLKVPVGWGTERLTDGERMSLLINRNPALKEELLARKKVDQEMRELATSLGVTIQETAEPLVQEDFEFTVSGENSPETELATVREFAPDIRIPKAVSVREYSQDPFLPAVAVFQGLAGAQGKYLLETTKQQNDFLAFLAKEGKTMQNKFVIKEFIDTPGDRFTSYRVIVSATGKILASGLLYSGDLKQKCWQYRDVCGCGGSGPGWRQLPRLS